MRQLVRLGLVVACLVAGVLDPGLYKALVESYPPLDLFTTLPEVGRKCVLSEKYNPREYRSFGGPGNRKSWA